MSTRVNSVEYAPLDIPMRFPFGISGGAQAAMNNLLVTVTLRSGVCGYGEAAPLPPFNGETQEGAKRAIESALPRLFNADVSDARSLAEIIREGTGNYGSARCALEMACLDALAREWGVPYWRLYSGEATACTLRTDLTITTGTVEQAIADAAQLAACGFQQMKIKVGGVSPDLDFTRVAAAHSMAPRAEILLDGNAAFSADGALSLIERLRTEGVRPIVFEQPTAKYDLLGLKRVTDEGGVITLADESASSFEEARHIVDEKIAHGVNVKLMKYGLYEAAQILGYCRARSAPLMVGGMVESSLAMSCSACMVLAFGGQEFIRFIDLDTPYWELSGASPLRGGVVWSVDGRMDLSGISAGHGVGPRSNE